MAEPVTDNSAPVPVVETATGGAQAQKALPPQPLWTRLAPGAAAGLCTAIVANPLDVLKTRLQSAESSKRIISEIAAVRRTAGLRGFYSGLPASIFSLCATRSFYFALFSYCLDAAKSRQYDDLSAAAIAAASTSLTVQFLFAPVHMIRTLQFIGVRGTVAKPSIVNCAKLVLSSVGPRGFWLGLPASMIGTGETVMFWVLYTRLQKVFGVGPSSVQGGTSSRTTAATSENGDGRDQHPSSAALPVAVARVSEEHCTVDAKKPVAVALTGSTPINESVRDASEVNAASTSSSEPSATATLPTSSNFRTAASFSAGVLISSGLSRFIASFVWYPHEVLRTRMRESIYQIAVGQRPQTLKLLPAIRQLASEGFRGAFGGASLHLTRQVPTTMTTWLVFEAAKRYFEARHIAAHGGAV